MVTDGNMVTAAQSVEERIRQDYAEGLSYRKLAEKYRKSLRDISKILKGDARGRNKTLLSVELGNVCGDKGEYAWIETLLNVGNIKRCGECGLFPGQPFTEQDIKDYLFVTIAFLYDEGWRINRADLTKFLKGTLDFAAVRWIRSS